MTGPDACAQTFPAKPVRFIVPFATGGASDIVARVVGIKLGEAWGQTVVIDNRAGGSGMIGTELVARAAPDGYVLLVVEPTFAITPGLFTKVPFDVQKDFVPIVQLGQGPQVLVVHPSVPVKTVKELIALAKAKPGQLNFASPGTGTTGHLGLELFKMMAKVDMVHIPYKGAGPAVADLLGGQVSVAVVSVSSAQTNIKAGRLRALGVTSAQRFSGAPEIPTIAEAALPGFATLQWWGLVAPRGTPAEVVNKIAADAGRLVASPEMKERMLALGAEPVTSSPERFAAFLREEIDKWGKLVRASGARAD
jgi:tripartite-type tricarboxylate transporter receptor subunit TctC